MVVAPPGELDVERLEELVSGGEVSALWLTAGLFQLVAEENPGALRGLEEVWTGGDVVSPPCGARRARPTAPRPRVVNGYGPTETTTFAARHSSPMPTSPATRRGPRRSRSGAPLDGTRAYVLDDALRPVPAGVPGELYVARRGRGPRLPRPPGLTAERFVADPYGPPGARHVPHRRPRARWPPTARSSTWAAPTTR